MTMRSLVVVNPNASRLRDSSSRAALIDDVIASLERRDGAEPDVQVTASQDDTRPAVEAGLADGVVSVVGVGGDGTLRGIASVLRGSGVPLGIVPGGTGNQLAAVLGVPLSLSAAVEELRDARRRTIDLGEVTIITSDAEPKTGLFTIGCGVGFDARIMKTTSEASKERLGPAAYFVQAIKLAMTIEAVPYSITVDGQTIETDASVALIGNMGQLVPGALDLRLPIEPDDGLLDLIVVGARGPIHGMKGLVDQLLRTSLGGGSGSDSVRVRGRAITIEADRPEPLQVDGDYVGSGSLEASVLPAAIDVLVPAATG